MDLSVLTSIFFAFRKRTLIIYSIGGIFAISVKYRLNVDGETDNSFAIISMVSLFAIFFLINSIA